MWSTNLKFEHFQVQVVVNVRLGTPLNGPCLLFPKHSGPLGILNRQIKVVNLIKLKFISLDVRWITF